MLWIISVLVSPSARSRLSAAPACPTLPPVSGRPGPQNSLHEGSGRQTCGTAQESGMPEQHREACGEWIATLVIKTACVNGSDTSHYTR